MSEISPLELPAIQARLERNRRLGPAALKPLPNEVLARSPEKGCERESNLHEQILDHCRAVGWIALHGSMAQATGRTLGEWDFVIVANAGRVFLVECKTATGKLTPEQAGMKLWAEKLGHRPAVVRSFAEFLEVVK